MNLIERVCRMGIGLRAVALVLVGLATAAAADEVGRPTIEITPGRARAFRVALQRFVDQAQPVNYNRAEDLRAAIGEALDFTGILLPLETQAYLGPQDSQPLTNHGRNDCSDWTQSGADALVEGEIRSEGTMLIVEFAVWDTSRCLRMLRKTMQGQRTQAPHLARRVADQIVGGFTGTPGSASTEIAFVSTAQGPREIFVMDAVGGNARAATRSDAIKAFPDWMPNGEAIVYTSYGNTGQAGLYLTSRGGVRPGELFERTLPGAPKYRGVFGPTGDYMALVASVDGSSDLFRIRRDGSQLLRLTRGKSIEVGPTWSPDGKQIAFVSDRSGAPQIYLMTSEGKDIRRLTFDGSYNTSPSWSPNGRWIAYETRVNGQFDIWLIDPTGEVNVPLITHRRSDESVSWSPDGRKLAFSSTRRGRADIYVVDMNGEQLQRLTKDQGDNLSPAWGPFPR